MCTIQNYKYTILNINSVNYNLFCILCISKRLQRQTTNMQKNVTLKVPQALDDFNHFNHVHKIRKPWIILLMMKQ